MRVNRIDPEFVVGFPRALEPGILYVSAQFSTAAHLCACGCRREVVTPLSPGQWILKFDGSISVWPSIGNWTFSCRSHYVIDHGTIQWAASFTRAEANSNRQADHRILDEAKRLKDGWWRRFRRRLGTR